MARIDPPWWRWRNFVRLVHSNPIVTQSRPQPVDPISTFMPPLLPVFIGQVLEHPGPPRLHRLTDTPLAAKVARTVLIGSTSAGRESYHGLEPLDRRRARELPRCLSDRPAPVSQKLISRPSGPLSCSGGLWFSVPGSLSLDLRPGRPRQKGRDQGCRMGSKRSQPVTGSLPRVSEETVIGRGRS